MPSHSRHDNADLVVVSSPTVTLTGRKRLELTGPRAQLKPMRSRQPPVRGDERLLRPAERSQVVRSGVAYRRVERRCLPDHKPEERVARNLEDFGPGVGALRGNTLFAGLDVAHRVQGFVSQSGADIDDAEPELSTSPAHKLADPCAKGRAYGGA